MDHKTISRDDTQYVPGECNLDVLYATASGIARGRTWVHGVEIFLMWLNARLKYMSTEQFIMCVFSAIFQSYSVLLSLASTDFRTPRPFRLCTVESGQHPGDGARVTVEVPIGLD